MENGSSCASTVFSPVKIKIWHFSTKQKNSSANADNKNIYFILFILTGLALFFWPWWERKNFPLSFGLGLAKMVLQSQKCHGYIWIKKSCITWKGSNIRSKSWLKGCRRLRKHNDAHIYLSQKSKSKRNGGRSKSKESTSSNLRSWDEQEGCSSDEVFFW